MTKDINLLSISHSYVKKINLNVYFFLKNINRLKVFLIIPKTLKEENKIIEPDFNIKNIDLNIIIKKTIFNHLRLKLYRNLKNEIKNNKITHILLDQDLISLQSLILILFI